MRLRRALWALQVIVLAISPASCRRVACIDETSSAKLLVKKCIQTVVPLFLIRRTEANRNFSALRDIAVVAPRSDLAPASIEDFRSGHAVNGPFASIIRIVEPGTRLEVEHFWRLTGVEGSTLAVTGKLQTGEIVEISSLLALDWQIINRYEGAAYQKQNPGGDPLDPHVARWCQ